MSGNHNVVNFKKGQEIYRASKLPVVNSNKTSYFMFGSTGLNKVGNYYTKAEGTQVRTYITTKNLRLIKLSSVNSIKYLIDQTRNVNLKKNIINSFRIVNNIRVVRNSETNRNRRVAEFICLLGFDGYIANELNKSNGGNFHQELVLCDPYDKIKLTSSNSITKQPPSISYMRSKGKRAPRVNNSPPSTPPRKLSPIPLSPLNEGTPPPTMRGVGVGY